MKNNTFKRVLAGSLALLTVAAYVPANVGGILPDLSIVASAEAATDITDSNLKKLTNDVIFDVDEDTVPFVEGLYEITTNAGKYVYNTPKKDADIYKLANGKAYVLRTKAILDQTTTGTIAADKAVLNVRNEDLNGDALPEGVYEYVIEADAVDGKVLVKSVTVTAPTVGVNEKLTVNQNGKEIKYDGGVYSVAKGFPVEITATPGETHTNMMLQATGADTKSQTKEGTALTLTVVPTDDVTVSWAEYKPTLQLTNDNGSIKATDVGFNKLVENVEIGTYEFRYGYGSTTFTAGGTNAKGEYVADSKSYGSVTVTAKPVTVGNTTYTFLNAAGSLTAYTKDDDAYTLEDADGDGNLDDMKKGKYVATTTITLNSSAVQAGPLKIVKEFTVADPTGVSSIVFEAIKTVGSSTYEVIQPEAGTGIYSVPWTGKEIVPKLTLMQPDGKTPYTENEAYTVTGTTKATDIGTYTMTISPKDKNCNEGKSIEITWKIVDSNSYVEFKNSKQDNTASDPVFSIGYRQASIATIKEQITKKLNFVGSQELYVVKYVDMDSHEVTDPSEKAGTYIAYVANALQNDGETSAMRKNNAVYKYAASGDEQYLDTTSGLFKVYFKVTPTQVQIVPTVTEITYGDDVKLNNLYKVIDFATKEEIGVPWSVKPTIALTGKNGETAQTEDQSTTDLPAGEYTYNVTATPLDATNYNVLVYDGTNLDKIDFTVNPRNLSDMEFEVASVEVDPVTGKADITKKAISEAANSIIANPALIGYKKVTTGTNNLGRIYLDINGKPEYDENTTDFVISGGTTSVKVSETGKMFTVNIKGTGNFTGTKAVSWKIGSDGLPEGVLSYEAEFDASKPRVMAKLDLSKLDGDVVQGGFLYNNNGKMNDIPLAEATDILKKEAGQTGNANQRNCKVVSFSEKAVKSALSGDGVLTAEIANSSVLKQVYIVPYVVYANGNISYGTAEKFNYYDMVMTAEGALEMSKTDFVGDGKTGTAGQTYVKVDVTRVDKKGYDVERYGILYNNSDSWDADSTPETADNAEMIKAYKWLDLNNESEKTVKVAQIPEEDLAKKIGTNTYILNTTKQTKDADGKVTKDYGYGAKNVFARAFIKIKDASGNSKVYYSNLADVTYGGFTVDTATGTVKGVEYGTGAGHSTVLDTNNKTQILFYDAAATRMAASTGDKTFAKWFEEQKKNK